MKLIHGTPQELMDFYLNAANSRGAKFIGEFDFGDWDVHVPVFYNKEKHPRGSHYFGLYHQSWIPNPLRQKDEERWMITDAGKIETRTWNGFVFPDEGILYSRSRHDYRSKDGYTVDGGFDYARCSSPPITPNTHRHIFFTIKDGEIHELPTPSEQTA